MAKRRRVLNDVLSKGNTSKEQFKELGPSSLQIDDLSNRIENIKDQVKDPNFNVLNDGETIKREVSRISADQKKVTEDINKYKELSALKKAIQRNKFIKSKVKEAEINEDIKSELNEPKKSKEKKSKDKKPRQKISRSLKRGVDSGFKIDESADDSGFGTARTKEKYVQQSAREQNDFNKRYRAPSSVTGETYDNSPGEVPQDYDGSTNSFSDYRIVDQWKKSDKARELEPGSGNSSIPDWTNYTASDARRMDPVYANAAGLGINQMMRRKDAGTAVYGIKNQPTLDNPNATGLDEKKGQSLVTAIQQNPVSQVTQNEVLNTGVNDASSPSQLQQAVQISNEAKNEAEKIEGNIDQAAIESANIKMVPYGSVQDDEEIDVIQNVPQEGNTQSEVPPPTPPPAIPGDGSTITNVITNQDIPNNQTYDKIATNQDVQQGIINMYANLNKNIPYAVVEKLGIQDYYPNIGRDIAVGTFSGSRIGSQTIYSGMGGVLPMGLYDARKRALKSAADEKKKQLDKFFDVIETAPQYQKAVNESYNNWLNQSLAEHGYDANKFLSDPNMRKEYAIRLSNAKDITFWANWADNYLKESEKKENYGTAEGVKIAGEIKMALVEHMDEIASGEKSLKDFIDIDKAKMYQNIIPQMDIIIKEVLDPNRMGESPINMRTGDAQGRLDPEEFVQQRDEFVIKMKSGTLGKDEYLSGFKKFFTGDYEKIVDGLIESGKFSEEQRDAALDYFAGQMQEQIKLNPQFIDNDQMEMARLAEEKRQFDLDYERKVEEGKTPWTVQNELMNRKNSNGRTMQQELLEARRKGYTGDKLKAYMLRKAREMGFPNAEWDPHLGTVVLRSPASQYESSNYWNVSTTNKEASIKLYEKKKIGGKDKWVPVVIPVSDFVSDKNALKKYKFDDGSALTQSDFNAWKSAWKNNSLAIRPSSYESYYGVSGSSSGIQRPVNSNTINDYDPSRGVNIKNSTGTAYGYSLIKDANGKPILGSDNKPQYQKTALKGTISTMTDINDPTQRRVADGLFGNDARQFDYTLQGGTSSSSSGRSSSQ